MKLNTRYEFCDGINLNSFVYDDISMEQWNYYSSQKHTRKRVYNSYYLNLGVPRTNRTFKCDYIYTLRVY